MEERSINLDDLRWNLKLGKMALFVLRVYVGRLKNLNSWVVLRFVPGELGLNGRLKRWNERLGVDVELGSKFGLELWRTRAQPKRQNEFFDDLEKRKEIGR